MGKDSLVTVVRSCREECLDVGRLENAKAVLVRA